MVEHARSVPLLCAALALMTACGSKHHDEIELLDPTVPHYGKTYAEWAEAWNQYWQSFTLPDCLNPISDATGKNCTLYQDAESPVFFLTGTTGGPVERAECVVPSGKALFFPLLEVSNDNAGMAESQQFTDEALKAVTQAEFDGMIASSLELSVDGQAVDHVDRGVLPPTRCVTHFPSTVNHYQCDPTAAPVQGDYPGYVTGFWALLAPLPVGEHTLHFAGHALGMPGKEGVALDVSYSPLTVDGTTE